LRPSSSEAKVNVGAKAVANVKDNLSIRLPVKKMYCTKCKKLVRGQAQNPAKATQITCGKCGLVLWVWKNISWRSPGNGVNG
jgi:RNase P subunit RPR2